MSMDSLAVKLAQIGAPFAASLLRSYGGKGGEAAGWLIEQLANSIGVEATPEAVHQEIKNNPVSAEAVMVMDRELGPEWALVYQTGIASQAALAASEAKQGGMASSWRWGWMYLLAVFWLWTIIFVPLVNAVAGSTIETIDIAILLTLTSWFIALYMGGHTVKELGKNALDAVRAMRENK